MTSTDPQGFTEEEWRKIRRAMDVMPYAGAMHPASARVLDAATLVEWLGALRERLRYAAQANEAAERQLLEAHQVIDAGRLVFGALAGPILATILGGLQPAPAGTSPDQDGITGLTDAIRCAIRDQGDQGATAEDIGSWIADHSGGPVPLRSILTRTAGLVVAGEITEVVTASAVRRFFLPTARCAGE